MNELNLSTKLAIVFWTIVLLASLAAVAVVTYSSVAKGDAPEIVKEEEKSKDDNFEPTATEINPEQVEWVKANAIPMASVDPLNEEFADLEPLKELIGDARIVQLGEQSHGDGICFETKVRLVKFLHQEMGFDVLAFESGLYDCRKAWEAYVSGDNAQSAASEGVFGIWTGSKQTAEMWNYLEKHCLSENPLELAGFDCQFTASASGSYFVDEVRELCKKYASETIKEDELKEFCWKIGKVVQVGHAGKGRTAFDVTLGKLKAGIAKAKPEDDAEKNELRFWKQKLESMTALIDYKWLDTPGPPLTSSMGRDLQMAANLKWLADDWYKGRKIIVWAASYHIVRDPQSIETFSVDINYEGLVQMGEQIDRDLGDDVFTVGFTAYDGRRGTFFGGSAPLTIAVPGTFESLCAEAGLENGIVPLRVDDGHWLNEPMFSRPLGYSWMRASWPKHFDAMIFNRTMSQSTR